jgi:hypothetical protein
VKLTISFKCLFWGGPEPEERDDDEEIFCNTTRDEPGKAFAPMAAPSKAHVTKNIAARIGRSFLSGFLSRLGWRGLVLLLALLHLPASSQETDRLQLNATEFKAAILSKVPSYVQWPSSAFLRSDSSLVIGIVGSEPFHDLLEKLLDGKQFNGRNVIIRRLDSFDQADKCHILYVPSRHETAWREARTRMETSGLLAIGETEEFLKAGGVFVISERDRKLAIHVRNAAQAGLKIDSKLLRISNVIRN